MNKCSQKLEKESYVLRYKNINAIVLKKHNVLLRVIGFITCNREMISEHISQITTNHIFLLFHKGWGKKQAQKSWEERKKREGGEGEEGRIFKKQAGTMVQDPCLQKGLECSKTQNFKIFEDQSLFIYFSSVCVCVRISNESYVI